MYSFRITSENVEERHENVTVICFYCFVEEVHGTYRKVMIKSPIFVKQIGERIRAPSEHCCHRSSVEPLSSLRHSEFVEAERSVGLSSLLYGTV